ncbi:unnamed protein product [Nyctereutes procyonoides]|uniref:(raccoon dog) hypothetical protein n=1 Tax=Nyctereutes procyonoides TaxID=34880 RepID=A0A811Y7H3_NYCPR|nr:unnamed protein product [Nyctereutes procyonoides]
MVLNRPGWPGPPPHRVGIAGPRWAPRAPLLPRSAGGGRQRGPPSPPAEPGRGEGAPAAFLPPAPPPRGSVVLPRKGNLGPGLSLRFAPERRPVWLVAS